MAYQADNIASDDVAENYCILREALRTAVEFFAAFDSLTQDDAEDWWGAKDAFLALWPQEVE